MSERLQSGPLGAFSWAPGLKNGDDNDSRQGNKLKEDAQEHPGLISEVERLMKGLQSPANSQRDGLIIPTADDDTDGDTKHTDNLFDDDPVKAEESPLRQHGEEDARDHRSNGAASQNGFVQDVSKHKGSGEQMRISGEERGEIEEQGAEGCSQPGHRTEQMSGKQPSFLPNRDFLAQRVFLKTSNKRTCVFVV